MIHSLRWASLLVVSTGCRQLLGFEGAIGIDATSSPDASADGMIDGPPETVCFGSAVIRPCFVSAPVGEVSLSASFDTDTDCPKIATLSGRTMCVLGARTLQVQGTVRVTGSRPLVIVGTDDIKLELGAVLDLSSSRATNRRGAGSPGACVDPQAAGSLQGGAGGGTLGARGGDGGAGGGQPGGSAAAVQSTLAFQGGCDGGSPSGGFGGGAVYLISQSIAINGTILANGGGGMGGLTGSGGAGAGSGGSIGIDSAVLGIGAQAMLVAVGGGGGSGSCSGQPGTAGDDATAEILAFGGNAPGSAGDGGEGGFQNTQAGGGGPGAAGCGGGGGGGGAGLIELFQGKSCPNGQCFPSAITHP